MKPTPFLDRREELKESRNWLPHWHQPLRLQFITWNLGDALPAKALKRLEREKARWLQQHPKPWTSIEEDDYFQRFSERVDRWLALGRGEALFKQPTFASLLADVLMHHEGVKTRMDSYVIMPNHVHCIVQLLGDSEIDRVMHSWRSFSALQLNRMRGKQGRLWGADYWDHMLRSPAHYWKVRNYIKENPIKANLSPGQYLLWMRDPPLWVDLQEEGFVVRPDWGDLS